MFFHFPGLESQENGVYSCPHTAGIPSATAPCRQSEFGAATKGGEDVKIDLDTRYQEN